MFRQLLLTANQTSEELFEGNNEGEAEHNQHTYLPQIRWPNSSLLWDIAQTEEIFSAFCLSGTCYSADLGRNLPGTPVAAMKAMRNLCHISSTA